MIQGLVKEMIENLEIKKEKILTERIDTVSNGEFCPEKEAFSRFKSVLHESHPDRDSYYYNNGTENGVHIVTFYKPKFGDRLKDIFSDDYELKFDFNIEYTFEAP